MKIRIYTNMNKNEKPYYTIMLVDEEGSETFIANLYKNKYNKKAIERLVRERNEKGVDNGS